MSLLIITGTIEINNDNIFNLTIKDTSTRLKQYLDALEYAIDEYKTVETIIFCDNSNYLYDYSEFVNRAKQKDKNLEILSFSGNTKSVVEHGKGYGEGEIMRYIFENSKYIHQYKSFYKLTGRLIVKNFDRINSLKKIENRFIYYPKEMYGIPNSLVSTVFYKIDKNTYLDFFIEAYKEVQDSKMEYLEVIFYKIIKKDSIKCKSFRIFPHISGYSGSTGLKYDLSKNKIMIENIINWLGLHNIKSNLFKQLLYKTIFLLKGKSKEYDK